MRTVTTAVAVALILLCAPLSEIGASEWASTYGGVLDDEGDFIVQTEDGGYVVAGTTTVFGADAPDLWVVKLNASGGVVWEKRYGGAAIESEASVLETTGGGYLVTGVTESFGAGGSDLWALKLDAGGEVLWQYRYGGPDLENNAVVQEAPGGTGYVLAGKTESFGAGDKGDLWVLGLHPNGLISWQKRLGTTGGGELPSCIIQSAGEYIIAGYTYSFGAGNGDFWVVSLNSSGAVSWEKAYGGTDVDWATAIQATPDGGFILAGMSTSFTGGADWDVWVLKLDGAGGISWQKAFGTNADDVVTSVDVTSDGARYVLTGSSRSTLVSAASDAWVMILAASGDVVSQHVYSGPDVLSEDHLDSSVSIEDDGFIAAGETELSGEGGLDLWLLKMDANGEIAGCPAMKPWTATEFAATSVSTVTSAAETVTTVSAIETEATVGDTMTARSDGCRPEPANLVSVARTGQMTSFHPGDDGDLRAGAPWPSQRFGDHGDGTVTDNLTGLMWLRDANVAATVGHDPNGTGDGRMEWTAALDFVAGIDDGTYTISAPHNDWRMPNINELESLAHWGEGDQATWLLGQGFSNVQTEPYWSSTTDVYQGVESWCIEMPGGHIRHRFKGNHYHLWLVREGQEGLPDASFPANIRRTGQTNSFYPGDDGEHQRGVIWPSPRFMDYGDGTVTDNLTGLMWLRDCDCLGTAGLHEAIDRIADFSANPSPGYDCQDYTADHSDWRVPNRREFYSLLDFSRINAHPAFPADHRFVNVSPGWHWSSTSYAPFAETWAWEFETGYGGVSHVQKGVIDGIFAVRDVGEPAWFSIFHDGFESGDTGAWSITVP